MCLSGKVLGEKRSCIKTLPPLERLIDGKVAGMTEGKDAKEEQTIKEAENMKLREAVDQQPERAKDF